MEKKMLEDIRRRLYVYDETMKSLHICMLELRDGVRFLVGKKIMDHDEPLIKSYNAFDFNTSTKTEYEGDTYDLNTSHEYQDHDVEEEPTIALVSALANASRDKEMANQTDVVDPVLRNVEAIKRFMRSSRKNHNTVWSI